jgi:hypothetical protein
MRKSVFAPRNGKWVSGGSEPDFIEKYKYTVQ